MSNETGFIQLSRAKETLELVKEQDAFTLLSIIALRARRTTSFNTLGLKQKEALIGDYKNYGMTEQRYRTSKSKLEKWGFATFKATNKGTVATLCNERIYDINLETTNGQANSQVTNKQRTGNERVTTNKNVKNENNGNNVNTPRKKPEGIDSFFTTDKYTLQQFLDKSVIAGLSDDEATEAYHHFKAQGFNRGNGQPLMDIESGLIIWSRNRHKFASKSEPDGEDQKRLNRERAERNLKNA